MNIFNIATFSFFRLLLFPVVFLVLPQQKAMYTSVLNKTIVEELAERNGTQKAGKITTFFRPRTTAAERAQTAPAIKKQAMSQVNVSGHNILMQLRKVCNHPYLVNWPLDYTGALTVDKTLISASGKMLLLDRVLPRLLQEGHKVLIFSQMTSMLDIIEDYLHLRNVDCFRLDGTVAFQERESQVCQPNSAVAAVAALMRDAFILFFRTHTRLLHLLCYVPYPCRCRIMSMRDRSKLLTRRVMSIFFS